jgi:hypothetical protein
MNSRKLHLHKPLLPGNQIRLMVLYPARHLHSPLVCNLLQTSLDEITTDTSPYETLLGWGSETRDHEILCDGKRMRVPQNCQLALRYLRPKTGTRTFWVEAICVDPYSIPEQNHLALVISDIYRCAKDVLLWMGEIDTQLARLIRRVSFVGRYLQFLDNHAIRHPSSDAASFRRMFTSKS